MRVSNGNRRVDYDDLVELTRGSRVTTNEIRRIAL